MSQKGIPSVYLISKLQYVTSTLWWSDLWRVMFNWQISKYCLILKCSKSFVRFYENNFFLNKGNTLCIFNNSKSRY